MTKTKETTVDIYNGREEEAYLVRCGDHEHARTGVYWGDEFRKDGKPSQARKPMWGYAVIVHAGSRVVCGRRAAKGDEEHERAADEMRAQLAFHQAQVAEYKLKLADFYAEAGLTVPADERIGGE